MADSPSNEQPDDDVDVETEAPEAPAKDSPETRLKAEAARLRKSRNDFKARCAELEVQLGDLTSERDALAAKIAKAPSKEAARIAELEGMIRARNHRDAFNRLAGGKVRPDALGAAWTLSGHAPEADEVDEAAMTQAIDSLLESNPFLAAPAAAPDPAVSGSPPAGGLFGRTGPLPQPLAGNGRGAAPSSPNNPTRPRGLV